MRVVAQTKGLVLDANAIVPAVGSMRVATNAVCDQPGIVRSRPTNTLYASKVTDYSPRVIRVYADQVHALSNDGSDWRFESESAVISGDEDKPTQAQIPRMEEARRSLYFTTDVGVRKYITGGAVISAGVEPYTGRLARGVVGVEPDLGTTLAGGPLPGTPLEGRVYFDNTLVLSGDVFEWYKTVGATDYVVYIVIKRTDANGYVRRSPPTRLLFAGATLPSTDAFLWQTYTVTSADVTAGYFLAARVISVAPDETDVFVPDVVNDDLLGEALYTNPGQQGALGAKYAPPNAAEMVFALGVMWYGNTISKHRLTTAVTNVAGSTDVATVDDENPKGLLGAITSAPLLNGTTTNGSPVVTGVSDDIERFLRAGMFMTDASNTTAATAGTAFPADTLILSWVTGGAPGTVDITVSKNATATGARDILIGDVVAVGGRNFYAWNLSEIWSPDTGLASGRRVFAIPNTTISATGRNAYAAAALAAAVNYESIFDSSFRIRAVVLGEPYVYSGTVSAPADILLEEIGVGGTAFTVSSSNPTAFSPNLPLTSTNDAEPGRLYYSEPDEPEAVPLPNFFRVGRPDKPILALTALRSSLLVWKEDGLYRVTGTAPDGWRVDPVDSEVRLVCSGVVDVDEGAAFAWTDRGVVRATETGVERVSSQIEDYLQTFATDVITDDLVQSWLVCWRSVGLVLLGLQANGQDAPFVVLALSTHTGSWSTFWNRGNEAICCATYDPTGMRMYWARSNAWELRRFANDCAGMDRTYSALANVSLAGLVITIPVADCGTWVPTPGDWIVRTLGPATTIARIVDVETSGANYLLTLASALGGGEGPTYAGVEGLPSELEWQNVGPAGLWERVREMQAHLDGEKYPLGQAEVPLALGMGGATSFTSYALVEGTPAVPSSYSRPYRYGVPRAVAWNAHFYPRVHLNGLGFAWRLHALAVVGEPKSDRVRR